MKPVVPFGASHRLSPLIFRLYRDPLMVRSGAISRARPTVVARVWLLPPGVLAGASAIALLFSPAHIRTPVAWCGLAAVVLTVITSAETARRLRSAEAARHAQASAEADEYHAQREAALTGRLADQRATAVWFAEELLPAAVARLQKGVPASEILQAVAFGKHLDGEFSEALRGALQTLLEAVEAEEHTRDSSQRALVAVARRVQAIVHQLAKDLHSMQILHGTDVVVSRGLQDIDHRNALIGRLAASIAVLGDARPGRQWSKAIPLYDVLRGAMSRIVDYPRVKLQAVTEVAVIGPGAEPLIHLLAELLDNATTFSPPNTPVEVTASEVPSGIAIEIEDRGVGLTEEVRQHIGRVMAQALSGIHLAGLGEVTQLGLPVVSRLAREHGCEVDLRTSAYGGVRAVVLVPRRLITTVPQPVVRPQEPVRKRTGGPILPRPTPARDAAMDSGEVRKTANGLPQRRRESPVPKPVVLATPTPPVAPAAPRGTSGTSRQPGLMWEAFNGEKRSVAEPSTPHSEPSDEVE
ncbi:MULTISPECIES: ATP-binding protein [unclassified Streptomyces]|uniref:ATP-binding protein n=1 Tax=unclassified Streptomyces TaxID=2593676 RepID=UPI001BEC9CD2|nr:MULTISPECIES: ATP-binding protein [unclassified Streptomyces]MBT2403117.1 sensor histidine kinase [Streptomyces sp. ISL-21]MBT2610206.1 sensor histidine kinase [Streptomyces sp. ISL-87]